MAQYNAREVEQKWQKSWQEQQLYNCDLNYDSKPKYYNLVMFPYPSGDKLHIGHWYNYAPADSWGRFMRMQGYNVFQPMGYDSFGLPAENYAIKTGTPPAESIATNTGYMTEQLSSIGAMWDWDKKVVTSTPEYYQWTQWVFLELYKKGLAYKKKAPVNWCPSCQTVLANEQVQDGKCERCKSEVTKKDLAQWFFKITDYSERLLDHSQLDWPQKTKVMQKNWIGRKEGIEITYKVKDSDQEVTVFTTRPETNFGATFVVISPEHPQLEKLTTAEHQEAVAKYQEETKHKSDIERENTDRQKTGVFTGSYAVNDLTGYEMPIYVADYVLMGFGTGVVVGVPGHDVRDFEFAQAMGDIEIKRVVESEDGYTGIIDSVDKVFEDEGKMINSEFLDGLHPHEAIPKMMDHMEEKGMGKRITTYRLRDWLISRQRYWGAPIPIVYDPEGNAHPVPEEHLPWSLPTDVEFRPDGTSPLAQSQEFIERTEKIFGEGWRPEVDTMDTFMCSSWYQLRYPCSKMTDKPFAKEMLAKWGPVDMYIGGPEHACMHLLYARFLTMALHDMGHVPFAEPFKKLIHQGMITKDGAKMSKSKGNVVSPDQFIERYGSDIFRMYLMFMGPFTEGGDWNDQGITGVKRFVDKLYTLITGPDDDNAGDDLNFHLHAALKRITEEITKFHFNTAVAACMEFVNNAQKTGITKAAKEKITLTLAPLAPHLAEELWQHLGHNGSIFNQSWPEYDEKYLVKNEIELVVQVNGKMRGKVTVAADINQEDAIATALKIENVKKFTAEGEIIKKIYVPGKLVSFVVKAS